MGLERERKTLDVPKKNESYKAWPWMICSSLIPPFHSGGRAAGDVGCRWEAHFPGVLFYSPGSS